jgi:hypothetical protein
MLFLRESQDFNYIKVLNEGANGKNLSIEGIFAQADTPNRNGRTYPKTVMESAVKKYISEFVNKKRALGELSHPENRPQVKPELASHLITELKIQGNNVFGKAKILETPQGQIVRGLLNGGVQLGVSTRALGSVKEDTSGVKVVQSDFQLYAVDVVSDPSGIDCWVNAINESTEWVVTDDGRILEKHKRLLNKGSLDEDQKLKLFADFLSDIAKSR